MCSSAPTSGWGLDLPNYLKDWVMKEQSENGSGLKIFLNQSEDGWEVENRTCEFWLFLEVVIKRLG